MARLYYENLSVESARYLDVERSRRRAHVTMIAIFEAGPLATKEGGVEFDRIREIVSMRLAELPRLRSKLRRVPLDGHPDSRACLVPAIMTSSAERPHESQPPGSIARGRSGIAGSSRGYRAGVLHWS